MNEATASQRILVIKHGALGDFIQAMGPFQAIRRHHPAAQITLLTTSPFAALARASGYFDQVWVDDRPPLWRLDQVWRLRQRLRGGCFDRVYDLQTSDRSSFYFRLFNPQPEWSGIASGASHPHGNPGRDAMHTIDRQAEQLGAAGIATVPVPDLTWLDKDVSGFGLPARFALLVPGGSAHRLEKRWPAASYVALAGELARRGVHPVLLGAAAEAPLLAEIHAAVPQSTILAGRTDFADIAGLARRAVVAIGNDTGPMHIIAASGCPVVVLFSGASDPALCAPRGQAVTILRRERLADLALEAVLAALPV